MSGTKHDFKKPPINLIPFVWIEGVARVLAFGAAKYGEWNWTEGFKWSRLIGAAERHLGAWKDGEDLDPETRESHLLHLSCEAMFLYLHERFGLGEDDRKKWPPLQAPETTLTEAEQQACREAMQLGRDPGFDPLAPVERRTVHLGDVYKGNSGTEYEVVSFDTYPSAGFTLRTLDESVSIHVPSLTSFEFVRRKLVVGEVVQRSGLAQPAPTSFAFAPIDARAPTEPPPVVDFNLDLAPEQHPEIPPPAPTPSETPHLDLEVERARVRDLRETIDAFATYVESRGIDATSLRHAILRSNA